MDLNPIDKSIEYFGKIQTLIDEKIGRSLRARARALPGMMESVGLIPTLSFCYGKAKRETYNEILKRWPNNPIEVKEEEGGYAIYLLLSLLYLRDLGIIDDEEMKDPIKAFKKLLTKGAIATRLLMPYVVEIKRLAEAVYGE